MLLDHLLTEQKTDNTLEQHQRLLKIFRKDTNVTHSDVKKLATVFGLTEHQMQLKIYDMLGDLLRNLGKHNNVSDSEFDKVQLKNGIKEEMEHTRDPLVAKMIAKDHLFQDPDYYKKLSKMVEKK